MERKVGREIGPTLLIAPCLLLAGSLLLWGLSGAIVTGTLIVVAACILAGADWVRGEAAAVVPLAPANEVEIVSVEPRLVTASETAAAALPRPRTVPVQIPTFVRRVVPSVRVETPGQALVAAAVLTIVLSALIFYLRDIGANPVSLFCDEAEIGLESYRLLHGNAETTRIPFFYHHFGYDLGFLPLVATAPFVAVFGLGDFAVRLASAFLMLVTFVVVFVTLRRLRTPYPFVAVALFAFSPIVIHLSRANFGHTPSIMMLALGFDRFVVGRQTLRRRPAIFAGLFFGVAAFGNPSFYVVTPLVIGAICLSELIYNGRQIREYATVALTVGFAALAMLPIPYRALTDETFWRRFREKNISTAPLFSTDRLSQVIDNYPKYFSRAYLFEVGEVGLPGSFISRHSVAGAGLLSYAALPVLLFAVISLYLLRRDPETRFFLPWFVVAALYPLPDLLTTNSGQPPYTVSIFGCCLCLPYLAGCALRGLEALGTGRVQFPRLPEVQTVRVRRSWEGSSDESSEPAATVRPWLLPVISALILILVTISGWRFYSGPYQDYPAISADYWGWQYGPKQMIAYYLDHQDEYDEFIMDGNFNEAYVFLDFYILDPDARAKASIGDITRLDLTKRQLFGIRSETWRAIPGSQVPPKSYLVIDTTIPYPNGNDGMYLMEVR